jgi:hypothetical protein
MKQQVKLTYWNNFSSYAILKKKTKAEWLIVSHIKSHCKPGMVAPVCNTQELRQKEHEFKASLGYTARPCFQKEKKLKVAKIIH